jgi:ubiquitin C-terminal hydrolase
MSDPYQNISINSLKYTNRGKCGLVNLGNTCFMNSIIQCIRHNYNLTEYFLTNKYLEDTTNNKKKKQYPILVQWVKLINGIYDGDNCPISPESFLRTFQLTSIKLKRHLFGGFRQNDAQEFLQFLVDSLHESLENKVKISISGEPQNDMDKRHIEAYKMYSEYFKSSYSPLIKYYYGQFISEISNNKNDTISYSYDPFCCISLEIPTGDNLTIYDCLDHFTKQEELEDYREEKHPEETKYKKKIRIIKSPEQLIIFFKRFNSMNRKIQKHITFPLENLNLSKYIYGYDKNDSLYDLYAVSYHMGGCNGGHYVATCKNIEGDWYNYDDDTISKLKDKHLDNIDNQNSYCVFYKKK